MSTQETQKETIFATASGVATEQASEVKSASNDTVQSTSASDDYWRFAQDSLLTQLAINMFMIACQYDGKDFDKSKVLIDQAYADITKKTSERNGGKFQTAIKVYEEAGWLFREKTGADTILTVTPKGRQVYALLNSAPGFLQTLPKFLVESLMQYYIDNPQNALFAREGSDFKVFPYWSFLKIFRGVGNYITAEEIRRFVFRVKSMDNIDDCVREILSFRKKQKSEDPAKLIEEYGEDDRKVQASAKYFIGRAGVHFSDKLNIFPALIEDAGGSNTYKLNPAYNGMVDALLSQKPAFDENLSAAEWREQYGEALDAEFDESVKWIPNKNINSILDYFNDSEYTCSDLQIKKIHASLNSRGYKHFVVLAGVSGTGKSMFSKVYADALYKEHLGGFKLEKENPYYMMVAVKPDWMDSSHLLGYYNIIDRKWVNGPLLEFILKARKEPDAIFVMCLDEMNLQRVEYYFAEVLSSIESKQPIMLHNDAELEKSGVLKAIVFPSNLFIIGTINVDDTVKMFSDKVLDRVDVITMSNINLSEHRSRLGKVFVGEYLTAEDFDEVYNILENLYNILAGYHMQFGYRTFKEIYEYIVYNNKEGLGFSINECIDINIMQKVLPKIKGDEKHRDMVEQLSELLKPYSESHDVVDNFKQQSEIGGFHFWN
ncbi:McrB family protein [Hymenobacter yonginensis]|uniref:ATPase dynein-related AAA domain-containing protein n=1 Tax=Hymenobacter yonginensis TaxID=748197 RepID=A0ABY7PTZ7_9BACT|nr:hypothetical protein [Hymenobacter yonginensis]WBO86408.1 hypothetical protein O9Z63_09125 [Hymenobacter yonginensis]